MRSGSAYSTFSTRRTPQTEPIPGQEDRMVPNHAGGFAYDVGALKQFERFLILGSEGGTYYVSERKLTKENALNAMKVIEAEGRRAVDLIVDISHSGRAPKNDPAIFALALASAAKDPAVRAYALAQLPKVCRIPTHLFHFLTYVKQVRGFGRGLKRAVAAWYQDLPVDKLAYQVVKYQSRDGWSNADALRLSHPVARWATDGDARNGIYRWIVDGVNEVAKRELPVHPTIAGFELAKQAPTKELVQLIADYGLSREMLPTEALTKPEVWAALLPSMGMTALIRNLGTMSKVGLLTPLSEASRVVVAKLTNRDLLKKDRIHPIQILIALKTYAQGQGMRGSGTWTPAATVVDALNDAFYAAFDHLVPTGKRLIIGVDVSGSMGAAINNIPMRAREGAAAMAMACIRAERDYQVVLFDTSIVATPSLTKSMSLVDIERVVNRGGGGTDCAQPMVWATENKIATDAFLILTDNETWAGRQGHPSQVMRLYRERVNPAAKIVNVGMTATDLSVNDPTDLASLDVVGFDASVPTVISDFVRN